MSAKERNKGAVEVTVNNHKVKIHSPATGLEIKQAAVDAGVPIELDFILDLERGDEAVEIARRSEDRPSKTATSSRQPTATTTHDQ